MTRRRRESCAHACARTEDAEGGTYYCRNTSAVLLVIPDKIEVLKNMTRRRRERSVHMHAWSEDAAGDG
jgi:hypothetical protein